MTDILIESGFDQLIGLAEFWRKERRMPGRKGNAVSLTAARCFQQGFERAINITRHDYLELARRRTNDRPTS